MLKNHPMWAELDPMLSDFSFRPKVIKRIKKKITREIKQFPIFYKFAFLAKLWAKKKFLTKTGLTMLLRIKF